MSKSFIVLTPAQAKKLAKSIGKARAAVDAVGVQLVAIGVENMLDAVAKKPRKPRAPKAPAKTPKAKAASSPASNGADLTA